MQYINLSLLDLTDADLDTSKLQVYFCSKNNGYVSYILPEIIFNKISRLFNEELLAEIEGIFLQVITPPFNNFIHRDPRMYAVNYIFDTGGGNVKTCFYNDNRTEYYVIPVHKWHIFRSDVLHCVKNIETVRKSITISFKKEIELDKILKLING